MDQVDLIARVTDPIIELFRHRRFGDAYALGQALRLLGQVFSFQHRAVEQKPEALVVTPFVPGR